MDKAPQVFLYLILRLCPLPGEPGNHIRLSLNTRRAEKIWHDCSLVAEITCSEFEKETTLSVLECFQHADCPVFILSNLIGQGTTAI